MAAVTALRIARTVAIAVLVVTITAAPAGAHGATGGEGVAGTNFRTRLHDLDPPLPGVDVEIIELGSRIQLTNNGDTEVVVLGYSGEPFLRVGPDGVFENLDSPSTFISRARDGAVDIPSDADGEGEPRWERASSSRTARWHDHRIHWMGDADPPSVRAAPDRVHVISEWVIALRQGPKTAELTGDLAWVPGPSPWPWLAGAVGLAIGAALLSLWIGLRGLGAVLAVAVAVDAVHVYGSAAFLPGGFVEGVARVAAGGVYTVAAWGTGIAAVVLLLRRRDGGIFLGLIAASGVALIGGVVEIGDLSRSQLPFALDPALDRLAIAASMGLGVGYLVAAVLMLRRLGPPAPAGETAAAATSDLVPDLRPGRN